MKNLKLIVAMGAVLASYQCFALKVDVNRYVDYSYEPGGEFTLTLDPSDAGDPTFAYIYQNYAAVATYNNGFETFCINTSIGYNTPANGALDPSGVTAGTAFLYYEFAKGTLNAYNYIPGIGTRGGATGTAYELQNAIWLLQGQTVYSMAAAAAILTDSQFTSVFGSVTYSGGLLSGAGIVNGETANNGTYGTWLVDQLHLSNPTTGAAYQPMLALVPDGGATVMLLGMGLCGLFMVSRKLRRGMTA